MFTLPITRLQPATEVCFSARPGDAGGADNSAMYAIGKLKDHASQPILLTPPP